LPLFRATIGTPTGERLSVEREAPSATAFASELRARGLFPLEIEATGKAYWNPMSLFGPTFSRNALLRFSRSVRSLVHAGISIYEALQILLEAEDHEGRHRVYTSLFEDISRGLALSEGMARAPSAFPGFYVKTIEAAERTGDLEGSFDELIKVLERNEKIRRKLVSASVYPAILSGLLAILMAVMLFVVLPSMEEFMLGLGVPLPWDTQALLALSQWMKANALALTAVLTGLVYAASRALELPSVRKWTDEHRYRIPILGVVLRQADLALVFRTLSALAKAAIPATEALSTASAAVSNQGLKSQLTVTVTRVERGESLSSATTRSGLLDRSSSSIIRVGEESGSLANCYTELAVYCEEQLEIASERLTVVVEIALIVIVALFVLFALLTYMRPMLYGIEGVL